MAFNVITAVKFVASGIVGIGTSKIVSGIIKNNVTAETLYDKVTVLGATWVISGMATTATKTFTDEAIDDIHDVVVEVKEKIKYSNKIARINREESTFEEEGLNPDDYRRSPETNKWVRIDVIEADADDVVNEDVLDVDASTNRVTKNATS